MISCTNNAYLFGQFGEELVLEHRQVWGYISDAAVDAPFEISLYKCHSISDALRMMREWSLPLFPAERFCLWRSWREFSSWGTKNQKLFSSFSASSRNVHRTTMLLSSVVVFGTGGPWAAVACLGSSSSCSNTGLATVAYRGSSSSCNTGFTTVVYRGSSSSSNGLAAVVNLINTNVAPILFLPPGRRDSSRHGESIHQEVTGEHGRNPLSAPATEAVPDTSVFPAASSKAVAEAPTSSAGATLTAVPAAAAPATGGTVFPTTSVGGEARAPAPADETAASKAASTASGTVPSATPLRGAVGARESSAGAASSDAVSKAAPATSGTVPSATPLMGAVGARESSAGAASSDAVSKAAPATSGTVTSATPLRGAVGARESSAGAAPSDVAAEAFPLAVRYNNNSSNSSNNIIISSNGINSNGSSSSSNDTTSNHDSWWEATYVGALLRPFDPGKGSQRDARIGVILGLDLPFDRGKA